MLGIGWFEIFIVAAGALIVVGPKDLPAMLRNVGKFVGAARRSMNQIRSEFNQVIQTEEVDSLRKSISEPLQDFKRDLNGPLDTSQTSSAPSPKMGSGAPSTGVANADLGEAEPTDVYEDILAVTKAEGDDLVQKAADLDAKTFKPEAETKAPAKPKATRKRTTTKAAAKTTTRAKAAPKAKAATLKPAAKSTSTRAKSTASKGASTAKAASTSKTTPKTKTKSASAKSTATKNTATKSTSTTAKRTTKTAKRTTKTAAKKPAAAKSKAAKTTKATAS